MKWCDINKYKQAQSRDKRKMEDLPLETNMNF